MQSVANAELVFIIIIIILHGEIAVDDISAFICYIWPFFMSLMVFLARFACHTIKKKEQRKERKKNLKQT